MVEHNDYMGSPIIPKFAEETKQYRKSEVTARDDSRVAVSHRDPFIEQNICRPSLDGR